MTLLALRMPRLGETMEEGRIARWLKAAGEEFARGEALLEIETDKTVAEFPALHAGRLIEILHHEGDMVAVDASIARVEVLDPGAAAEKQQVAAVEVASKAGEASSDSTPRQSAPSVEAPHGSRRRATPVARRLARRHELDIETIGGSGRRGRIEGADVLDAVANGGRASNGKAADDAPDLRYAVLAAGRVAYTDLGPPDGEPFLLLHGFAADRTTWAAVAAGLKRGGRRVLVPDLPGHGLTEIEASGADRLNAFLPEFLDAVASEAGAMDLVAHSLGALPAVALAKAAPDRVRRLTLIAPAGIGPEIDDAFIRGIANTASADGLAHWLRRLTVRTVELSTTGRDALAADLARGRLRALGEAVAGPGGQQVDILPDLGPLARLLPVRVLVGLHDRIIPWRQVTALPSGIAVHFLANSGHMPQWDEPREVLEILMPSEGDRR